MLRRRLPTLQAVAEEAKGKVACTACQARLSRSGRDHARRIRAAALRLQRGRQRHMSKAADTNHSNARAEGDLRYMLMYGMSLSIS
mmetsp:Transcript_52465/g.122417  ORF Transcript_52465/g.122417 Transcript_52465/m.122417 type:complete len:86 (-) Transcript_52465:61-318(-)